MSTNAFDLSKYTVREKATVTLVCPNKKDANFSPPTNAGIQFYADANADPKAIQAPNSLLLHVKAIKMDRPEPMLVYFAVWVIDVYGEKQFVKGFDWTFNGQDFVCQPIISRSRLSREIKELRPNGRLTVVVEASILEAKSINLSSTLCLSNDLQPLLQTGKFADVVLIVKGTKEFKAHKAIISTRSPVLAAMFEHDCAESRQNRVEIPDIDVEVFEELLRYLYTDRVDSLEQYAAELYLAADKYQVESLKRLCEQALLDAISADTFAKLIVFADSYDITELREECYAFFTDHHKEIVAIEGWNDPLLSKPELLSKLAERLSKLLEKLKSS